MTTTSYIEFAESCLQDLIARQAELQSEYDLDGYDNWFYNQSTGLLTFSSTDKELNFGYLEVGTFSRNTETWKWSWANEHTLPSVKEGIEEVRKIGEKSGYEKLASGYFKSSEEEAWQLAAITNQVVGALGVYRPVSEHLLIFMVLVEVIDNQTAQDMKEKYVECDAHDYKRRAFVCQHLNRQTKVGFVEAFETSEGMELYADDDFQAWCDECEQVRKKSDGWNDESMVFADIKLLCEQCYFDIKELNLGYR